MAWVDRATRRRISCSSFELMKKVSAEMSQRLLDQFQNHEDFLILTGPGNNGGDGYCVAEFLRRAGRQVAILPVTGPQTEDCRLAARFCRAKVWKSTSFPQRVVVDAVFGSGGRPILELRLRKLFKKFSAKYRVSLDVPSGVSDEAMDPGAFRAHQTLVVAHARRSLFQEKAAECFGDLHFVGRDFVEPRFIDADLPEECDFSIRPLSRIAFKTGRVGVLAGSAEAPGAAYLAAESAHRMGVGYVELFFAQSRGLRLRLPEASFLFHAKWSPAFFEKQYQRMDVWICGPGGVHRAALKKIARGSSPVILDAEALVEHGLFARKSRVVLTPHLGEAARLLHQNKSVLDSNRWAAIGALAELTGKTVYLKGAPGLLQIPGERMLLHYALENSLARAGSGDVLCGILAGAICRSGGHLRSGLISGLLFQKKIGELLRDLPAAISSDQLRLFSLAALELQALHEERDLD
jgi:NAD(P)H-hydrate epimerase